MWSIFCFRSLSIPRFSVRIRLERHASHTRHALHTTHGTHAGLDFHCDTMVSRVGASPLTPPHTSTHPFPGLAAVAASSTEPEPLSDVLRRAGRRALGGGIPGAVAMAANVATLMPLRTLVNRQYRYGETLSLAARTLYADGGMRRFYRGVGPALIQGPLSRFGDTASNAGALALLDSYESTHGLPTAVKTGVGSLAAGAFRIVLLPIDTLKTTLQVEGASGLPKLAAKIRASGPTVLWHGALASAAATSAGHWPWFTTFNFLQGKVPQDALGAGNVAKLGRSAFIGFCASAVSDTVSNSIRVIKVSKQSATSATTYPAVMREIVAKDGLVGLFGRGLKMKLLSNALQGALFSVFWRLGSDWYAAREAEAKK